MLCAQCEYPLWGLTGRVCPECGAPFQPSEFDFPGRAVVFRCPHCGHGHIGNGPRGHLSPRRRPCGGCGVEFEMDEATVAKAPGVSDARFALRVNPWLKRRGFGVFGAWLKTAVASMFFSDRLIRETPSNSSSVSAVYFAAATQGIAILFGSGFAITSFLFVFVPLHAIGLTDVIRITTMMVLVVALAAGVACAAVLFWSICAHAMLCATGEVAHGVERTIHAVGYSAGAMMISAIPCIGFVLIPVGWIWWGASTAMALHASQGVGIGRALAAGMIPPLALITALIMWFLL